MNHFYFWLSILKVFFLCALRVLCGELFFSKGKAWTISNLNGRWWFFAHPDDAEVQCAGTLAAWIEGGKKITYVSLTCGQKKKERKTRRSAGAVGAHSAGGAARGRAETRGGKVIFMENDDGLLRRPWSDGGP